MLRGSIELCEFDEEILIRSKAPKEIILKAKELAIKN
jgi:hypothetical protein